MLISLFLLTLAELELPSCLPATWLLSFHHPGIAGQQTFFSQWAPVVVTNFYHRAGDTETDRFCLAFHAAAFNIHCYVVVPVNFNSSKSLLYCGLQDF